MKNIKLFDSPIKILGGSILIVEGILLYLVQFGDLSEEQKSWIIIGMVSALILTIIAAFIIEIVDKRKTTIGIIESEHSGENNLKTIEYYPTRQTANNEDQDIPNFLNSAKDDFFFIGLAGNAIHDKYLEEIEKALKRGIDISIYILHPTNPAARKRQKDTKSSVKKNTTENIENSIVNFREFTSSIEESGYSGKFTLYGYMFLPYFEAIGYDILKSDNEANPKILLTNHIYNVQTHNAPSLPLNKEVNLFELYANSLKNFWKQDHFVICSSEYHEFAIHSEGQKIRGSVSKNKSTNYPNRILIICSSFKGDSIYQPVIGLSQMHLSSEELAVCTFDFRGTGGSTGTESSASYYSTDIKSQIEDLVNVVKYLNKELGYKDFILGGISLGGVISLIGYDRIIQLNLEIQVNGLLMWSPCFDLERLHARYIQYFSNVETRSIPRGRDGKPIQIGKKMIESFKQFSNHEALLKLNKAIPIQMIFGSLEHITDYKNIEQKFRDYENLSFELIEGSDHDFSEDRFTKDVLDKSKIWLRKL